MRGEGAAWDYLVRSHVTSRCDREAGDAWEVDRRSAMVEEIPATVREGLPKPLERKMDLPNTME